MHYFKVTDINGENYLTCEHEMFGNYIKPLRDIIGKEILFLYENYLDNDEHFHIGSLDKDNTYKVVFIKQIGYVLLSQQKIDNKSKIVLLTKQIINESVKPLASAMGI